MDKTAETRFPISPNLAQRWSPRAFADKPVEQEKLIRLLEAARWAPSCFNEQPWRFIVAEQADAEAHAALADCLVDVNKQWAAKAPLLMLSVATRTFARNGKDNRHALHDVGLAVANLSAEATALGLSVHQMAGFSVDKARETYQIPENCEPAAAIAIGYAGDPESLPEDLRERENAARGRKALSELVFSGKWGRTHRSVGGG